MNTLNSWLYADPSKTVVFAIVSGVIGFLAKSVYDLWLARRKDRLDRLNLQLKLLYGPLYALHSANNIAWEAFCAKVKPGGSFFGETVPPTQEQLESWKIWMLSVFQPINESMLTVIQGNADLLIGRSLPKPLELFCAHTAAYKAVLTRWNKGDYSEYTSVVNYPDVQLTEYLTDCFSKLKAEQARLLGTK